MRTQYTSEERSQLVALVMSEGVRVPDAAARLGVHDSTAYNWIKQAKAQAHAPPAVRARNAVPTASSATFVQLVRAGTAKTTRASQTTTASSCAAPMIEVYVAGTTVRVVSGFDAALLRAVVDALRGGAW
jgi:transposase-like protein